MGPCNEEYNVLGCFSGTSIFGTTHVGLEFRIQSLGVGL